MEVAPGVVVRPLYCDEGREVYEAGVAWMYGAPTKLALKYWDPDRLTAGGNTQQVCTYPC